MGAVIILVLVAFLLTGLIALISRIGQGPRPFRRPDPDPPMEETPERAGPSAVVINLPIARGARFRRRVVARLSEWRHSMLGRNGDWLPIVIGALIILISAPPFVAVAVYPDTNSGFITWPLLALFAAGIALGLFFVGAGIWLCTKPGFGMLGRLLRRQEPDDMPPAVRRFLDS